MQHSILKLAALALPLKQNLSMPKHFLLRNVQSLSQTEQKHRASKGFSGRALPNLTTIQPSTLLQFDRYRLIITNSEAES